MNVKFLGAMAVGLALTGGTQAVQAQDAAIVQRSHIQTAAAAPLGALQTESLPSLLKMNALAGGGKAKQLGPLGSLNPFRPALRLGVALTPRTGFAGGIDVSIPGLRLLPGFTTRIDADALVSFKGGYSDLNVSTLIPVTFDQVYTKGLIAGSRVYAGLGVGPYIGDTTRFGGKLFVGAGLSSTLGVEGTVHFAGIGDPLFTVQLRIGL